MDFNDNSSNNHQRQGVLTFSRYLNATEEGLAAIKIEIQKGDADDPFTFKGYVCNVTYM